MTTTHLGSQATPADRRQTSAPVAGPTTIGTLSTWEGGAACCLGSGRFAAATIGQIITAPQGAAALQHFTFAVQLPDALAVQGGVYGWDGRQVTGPALFAGAPTSHSGHGKFDEIGFTVDGVALESGAQYVLLLSADQSGTGHEESGAFGIMAGDAGRGYVYLNDHLEQSQWTTAPWETGEFQLAYEATFS